MLKFLLLACTAALISASAGYVDLEGDSSSLIHLHIVPIIPNPTGGMNTSNEHYLFATTTPSTSSPIQESLADAKQTFNQVIKSLASNPKRIFTCPDILYFQRWWNEQPESTQAQVKNLVQSGQLRFSSGAYVANDEATSYYEDMIENYIVGHRFLRETFNYVPLTGWNIRSHGHSATQAAIMADSGLNFNFVEQINFQNRRERSLEKDFEFVWRPFESVQKKENYLFTFIDPLEPGDLSEIGYCLASSCSLAEFGHKQNLKRLSLWAHEASKSFKSRQLLLQISESFKTSQDVAQIYSDLDFIIDAINQNKELKIKASYSSPDHFAASWIKEYSSELDTSLKVKSDDFFPYADHPKWFDLSLPGYWSGFYTSRPLFKKLVRDSGKLLQAARKIVFRGLLNKTPALDFSTINHELLAFETLVAEVQNVNAVSGTSAQRVIDDYAARITNSSVKLIQLLQKTFRNEDKSFSNSELSYFQCDFSLGLTRCEKLSETLTMNKRVLIKLYNPGSQREELVSIPVPSAKYTVTQLDGASVPSEAVCYEPIAYEEKNCRLYFKASFPALGYRHFVISPDNYKASAATASIKGISKILPYPKDSSIEFDKDMKTLRVKDCSYKITRYGKESCFEDEVKIDYLFYRSYKSSQEKSGIHVFMPTANTARPYSEPTSVTYTKTAFFHEFRVIRNDSVYTRIRLSATDISAPIEIETHLLPITFKGESELTGKEVVLRVKSTKIKSYRLLKTDSNGLDMITRAINAKPDFKVDNYDLGFVAGNYYPITSALQVEDYNTGQRLTIIPDRTQGGTSLDDGELELMINRRIIQNDLRVIPSDLDETYPEIVTKTTSQVVNGQVVTSTVNETILRPIDLTVTHKLLFSYPKFGYKDKFRTVQAQRDDSLQMFMAAVETPLKNYKEKIPESNFTLPENVRFVIRSFNEDESMIRFINYEDSTTSDFKLFELTDKRCTNNLLSLLAGRQEAGQQYCVFSEVSLSVNQPFLDIVRNKIRMHGDKYSFSSIFDGQNIHLKPMQTRSVIVSPHSVEWPAGPVNFNPLKSELVVVAPLEEIKHPLDELDKPSDEFDVYKVIYDIEDLMPSENALILLAALLVAIPIILAVYLRMYSPLKRS